jgi:1-pyrroline-5-carboxylate dehydrogenase
VTLQALNYIAGAWVESTSRERVRDVNPARSSESLGDATVSTPADVVHAIDAAAAAYQEWRRTPPPQRGDIVRKAADLMERRRVELARLLTEEEGKTLPESLGEVDRAVANVRFAAAQGSRLTGETIPSTQRGTFIYTVRDPLGVVACITPWNFPVAIPAWKIAPALVAGNTVVFKPSSEAPLTGLRLYEILTEAGVPPGVFQFVTGSGRELGDAFLDARFDGIVFTGSKDVGLDLYRRFAKPWPKPVIVEMGGKNPAIVTRNADLQKAAFGVARSAFGYGGQKCSACSRVFVANEVYDAFLERLVAVASNMTIGDPTERATYLGPLISAKARATHAAALAEARRDGRIVFAGTVPADPRLARGHFVGPVVADRIPDGHRLWRQELFVPFLVAGPVASLADALRRANDTEYGLTAGIFSEDDNEVRDFFDRIEAGVVYANRPTGATTGAWPGVQSFCGWKASGSTGKGGCGPWYVQQFLREQSRTIVR